MLVTAAQAEEVLEFTMPAAEAAGGSMALKGARTLELYFDTKMVLLRALVQGSIGLRRHRFASVLRIGVG